MNLEDAARSMGVELDEVQHHALLAHLDLLDEWNQRMNLTAIRDRPSQITKHVLDSLSVRPYLRGERIADVGSGAGFPGIPLAVVEPGRHFTLIESTGKKCRFLEQVRDALGLANVEVVHSRAEVLKPERRFDTVIARAVGPLADLVRYTAPLLAGDGRLIAMKGRYPEDELAAKLDGWKVLSVHQVVVPGLDEQRHVVDLVRSHSRKA
jgi:16S rRNA (guanine527-N7)-methyltransferase